MSPDKMEEFVRLAVRSGRIVVAEDVYAEIRKLTARGDRRLSGIEVVVDKYLAPGTVLTGYLPGGLDSLESDLLGEET